MKRLRIDNHLNAQVGAASMRLRNPCRLSMSAMKSAQIVTRKIKLPIEKGPLAVKGGRALELVA